MQWNEIFPDGLFNVSQEDRREFRKLLGEMKKGSANVGDYLLAQDQRKNDLAQYTSAIAMQDVGLLRELLASDPTVAFQPSFTFSS